MTDGIVLEPLDLRGLRGRLGFFPKLEQMSDAIKRFKSTSPDDEVALRQKDESEVGRHNSYAVFPELRDLVRNGGTITIQSVRDSLAQRGVIDSNFQNKILCLLLQHRSGMHFAFAGLVNGLFAEHDYPLISNNAEFKLELVVSGNKVTLDVEGVWDDISPCLQRIDAPREAALSLFASLDITPDEVVITDFTISPISNNPVGLSAYRFLQEHQSAEETLLEWFISFLKKLFNFNDLRVERTKDDNHVWSELLSDGDPGSPRP